MSTTDHVRQAVRESPASDRDGNASGSRRRKVRKGTRSCWECKRGKTRCVFSSPSDSACVSCRRRGSACVSQDYPEETSGATKSTADRGRLMGERIVRVEALVEQLIKQVGPPAGGVPSSDDDVESACVLPTSEPSRPGQTLARNHLDRSSSPPVIPTPRSLAPLPTTPSSGDPRYAKLSEALYAALPPRQDIDNMIQAGMDIPLYKLMTHPLPVLNQMPGGGRGNLERLPTPQTHPVLLAKYLLIIATCLQFAHPELHAEHIARLSEPPLAMMRRLADTAINLVTDKDEFLDSFEGLECVMLESMLEANAGNLRRGWFACRRAMLVAQMMGLHRSSTSQALKVLDPSETVYPSFCWFRIVCTDRQLCLMLGLPQGSLDTSMASEAALASDTPGGRFERLQCVVAMRILERNESSDPAAINDLATLHDIDAQLQRAGRNMPGKWWLVPNLSDALADPEKSFWDAMRLLEQMLYFNLLHLLHLPYMMRSHTPDTDKYDYSNLTCVSASRELLTRFVMFRSLNRIAYSCRSVDFFALTAAMTLIMAHLHEHQKQRQQQRENGKNGSNVLAHQRNSDRAMVEHVLENMEGFAKLSTDVLSERSSSLLKSLLDLESAAMEGKMYDNNFTVASAMTQIHPDTAKFDGHCVRIGIPYFGTVTISREGVVAMEGPPGMREPSPASLRHPKANSGTTAPVAGSGHDGFVVDRVEPVDGGMTAPPVEPTYDDGVVPDLAAMLELSQPGTQASPETPSLPGMQPNQQFLPQFSRVVNDALHVQYPYPRLTAGVDDWAFQGADMAFFDVLTRHSGVENLDDGGGWARWDCGSQGRQ